MVGRESARIEGGDPQPASARAGETARASVFDLDVDVVQEIGHTLEEREEFRMRRHGIDARGVDRPHGVPIDVFHLEQSVAFVEDGPESVEAGLRIERFLRPLRRAERDGDREGRGGGPHPICSMRSPPLRPLLRKTKPCPVAGRNPARAR